MMDTDTKLPDDVYSRTLARLSDNPAGVTTKGKPKAAEGKTS